MKKWLQISGDIYPLQKVYLQPLNAKKEIYSGLQEAEVISVGSKYVYVRFGGWKYKFDVETLEQVTEKKKKDWQLYASKEDYEKSLYYEMLHTYIIQHIGRRKDYCCLSLKTLEEISSIIAKQEE